MKFAPKFERIAVNDKHRFDYKGWYYVDIEAEIAYWTNALEDTEEYDTTEEEASMQMSKMKDLLLAFEEAFEAQRTDKVDYGDGSWV